MSKPRRRLRNLKRLRVVVGTEQDSGFYLPAGPVVQLLNYLLHEASPATSEMVRGFINALLGAAGRRSCRFWVFLQRSKDRES
jgi:hypothetical protein